jgi:nucleoside-diphosphate-sugar epimerase
MGERVVVFGFGAVGRATVAALVARGTQVAVAQRGRPADLPAGVEFRPCDILDPDALHGAMAGSDQAVASVGLPYDRRVWRTAWPKAMANFVEACAATSARLVFVDNLYMLGPQNEPLREDMPLSSFGAKPAIRSDVTRIWLAAAAIGRAKIAALRPPDFYGPHVGLSHIGTQAFGALATGKVATLVIPPDTPHDFAYVPDIARAVTSLLDAPDDVFGQAWNMPCAPTRTAREILRLGADALGIKLKVRSLPLWLLPALGVFQPFLREVAEMRFTFDRPYVVDASKLRRRFAFQPTPLETGAVETIRSFLPARAKA